MAGPAQELVDDDEPIAQINIIPFVDISLVLLIIFLLTSSVISKAAIPVELPKAAQGGETVDSTLNIVLTATGDMFVDGSPMGPEALLSRVEHDSKADPKLRAVIAADKSVRYEAVIQAIDIVKRGGVNTFALNIERPSSDRP